jgi:hypothetical protein
MEAGWFEGGSSLGSPAGGLARVGDSVYGENIDGVSSGE